jgi:hypothetical protein
MTSLENCVNSYDLKRASFSALIASGINKTLTDEKQRALPPDLEIFIYLLNHLIMHF